MRSRGPDTPTPEEPDGDAARRFRVGTLQYTKAGLVWLFVWLLWGDFVFTLMEAVVPSILPLRLRQLEAPDWAIPLVLATIGSTLNFVLNPIISTASDRHRGRWGRRIPFLMFATPLVSGALVLLAFSPEIGTWLHGLLAPRTGWSAASVAVGTLAVLLAVFKVFDMFINTVFWYFFNDVVPTAFMARFLGLFRVVGSLAGMLYNFFVYRHALTHMRWIFLGAASLYALGFLAMCLRVKEGQYAPAAPMGCGVREVARNYVRECLRHRIYWYFFLHSICWSLAGACGVFGVYLNLSLGITLAQLGALAGVVSVAQLVLNYPAGVLADRFHPLRLLVWMKVGLVLIAPLNLIWLFGPFTPGAAFRILVALAAVELPLGLLYVAVLLPTSMRILPKARFGQFCSFNAIVQAGFGIGASVVVGQFMAWMRRVFPDAVWGKDYCYRMIPLWRMPLLLLALGFLFLLYREWKRLGGATHYRAPGGEIEPAGTAAAAETS